MKTKFDRGMNMDIPHSPNIACAMYGFRELGAEIIPYHSLDEIYDKVQREDIVLDYILQCNEIFKKFGVEPYVPDYPEKLTKYLGRNYICLFNYLFISSQMSAKPYFIGSTGILLLW